ncbi:uncharacterized protein LOC109825640 isoform X1 [Asparagus officinalis]|uniref:uncharacterized protein LOC109825640 isoform X1 n=1 Tax=Asparagus officinalis TaxID=4686 RepID=UPI00098DE296|nr:uncharacterized protein LOC109825640 isoform X1 [Asparagus officinalis]
MEGVGARLGRSSTRFQPAVAFTGPVRKWTKRWVPLPNPSTTSNNSSSSNPNKTSNSEPSNLMLYKWTPISPSKNDGVPATPEDPPKRKFRYVPVRFIWVFFWIIGFLSATFSITPSLMMEKRIRQITMKRGFDWIAVQNFPFSAQPEPMLKFDRVSVTKNQKQDAAEDSGSEGGSSPQPTTEDGSSGKTNRDDVLMEDAQEAAEEANETNLDLNLN